MPALDHFSEAQRQELLAAAAKKGMGPERVEEMARWALMSPQQQAALCESIYAIIACSDSEIIRRRMLHELAGEVFLPPDLIISDYNRWLRAGGRPAA